MPDDLRNRTRARPGLTVDVARYQALLDDPGISEARKVEFLENLWVVLSTFIDLGMELHAQGIACGQLGEDVTQDCSNSQNMVSLESILKRQFEEAATPPRARSRKDSRYDE